MKITAVYDNRSLYPHLASRWGFSWLVNDDLLFDTGGDSHTLLSNIAKMGIDPAGIRTVVLSHAHYDHTDGLPALLERVCPGTPLYANPDLFREQLSQREGEPRSVGLSLTREELTAQLTHVTRP